MQLEKLRDTLPVFSATYAISCRREKPTGKELVR